MATTVLDILNLSEKEISRLKGYSEAFSRQFSWEDAARKDLKLLKTFKKQPKFYVQNKKGRKIGGF